VPVEDPGEAGEVTGQTGGQVPSAGGQGRRAENAKLLLMVWSLWQPAPSRSPLGVTSLE